MDLEEGHCNAPPGQVSPKAFPAGIERVRLAGARLAIADDGGGLRDGNRDGNQKREMGEEDLLEITCLLGVSRFM